MARTEDADGYTVTATTAEGRVSTKNIETMPQAIPSAPIPIRAGLTTVTQSWPTAMCTTSPDGTQTTVTKLPDPRFGMMRPCRASRCKRPVDWCRPSLRSGPRYRYDAPPGTLTQTDTLNINGECSASSSVRSGLLSIGFVSIPRRKCARQLVYRCPGADRSTAIPGIFNTDFTYDTRGRLTDVVQGDGTPAVDRTSSLSSTTRTGLSTIITDPVRPVVSFQYDMSGASPNRFCPICARSTSPTMPTATWHRSPRRGGPCTGSTTPTSIWKTSTRRPTSRRLSSSRARSSPTTSTNS